MNPELENLFEQLTEVLDKLRANEGYVDMVLRMQCETKFDVVFQLLAMAYAIHKQIATCLKKQGYDSPVAKVDGIFAHYE